MSDILHMQKRSHITTELEFGEMQRTDQYAQIFDCSPREARAVPGS